jgi:Ca-activated chloride channel family protein
MNRTVLGAALLGCTIVALTACRGGNHVCGRAVVGGVGAAAPPPMPAPSAPPSMAACGAGKCGAGGVSAAGRLSGITAGDGGETSGAERYGAAPEAGFVATTTQPLSTFSIDVDTASYANVRRFVEGGDLPPADAVRTEELVNYFPYAYPAPSGPQPFAASFEVADCPWAEGHRLVRVALASRAVPSSERPPCNLVFLVDVSGSMSDPKKLPLVRASLRMLVDALEPRDRVAIVAYAGAAGLVLPSTTCDRKPEIREAIDGMSAGGSTAGGAGIELAYKVAAEGFLKGGVNRVVLATDGDFNVGITDRTELVRLVEEKARTGVFLTCLGFGMGNLKDDTLESLADKGNGAYGYVDSEAEARKLLVDEVGATLVVVAKDVKLQVEFDPTAVAAWRLLGYDNRVLAAQDFADDAKDAGEIGAGHAVTAFYELVPPGVAVPGGAVAPLRYQAPATPSAEAGRGELLTLRIRHKEPDGDRSTEQVLPLLDPGRRAFASASDDFRFATAVVAFALHLRASPHRGTATLADVRTWADGARGADALGYRKAFAELAAKVATLADAKARPAATDGEARRDGP